MTVEKEEEKDCKNMTEEERTLRKLQGKCLHNFQFVNRYGDDIFYRCTICGTPQWF